ncbi:MAG: MFS transporter [Thermodesulfobacteriota bacterium]
MRCLKGQPGKILGFERNVFFTGLVSFFTDVGSEMIYPLVPIFLASVLGVNKAVIGVIEGIAESTASLVKLFSGWFSDRIGRRKILMVFGYGISTASRPFMALAAHWGHVLSARFIDRVGKGVRTAPRDVIIAESTLPTHLGRSFGFHRAMDTLGAVVGPLLAFAILSIYHGNYRLVFWLSIIPGLAAVFIAAAFVTEKKRAKPATSERFKFDLKRFGGSYKRFLAVITVFALGNSSDVFLVLRAQNLGVKTALVPLAYLTFNLVYALSAWPAGVLADRFGKRRLVTLGFVLFAVVYLGFGLATHPGHAWLLFPIYGLFMGISEGVQRAYLASIVPPDFKATGFGLYHMAIGLAVLPASMIGGLLWDAIGPQATFYYGAGTATLSALLFILVRK